MVVSAYDNNMRLIDFCMKLGQNVKKGIELGITCIPTWNQLY